MYGEVGEASRFASALAVDQQRAAVDAAAGHAAALTYAAIDDATPGLAATFVAPDPDVLEALVGHTAGGPLEALFAKLPDAAAAGVTDALVLGVAVGMGAEAIARQVRGHLGGNMVRARTIVRTETLRAYREATRLSWEENPDLVLGYRWHAALDSRTCATCWALHGKQFPTRDRFGTHPNCRCAMIPVTPTWEDLGVPGFPDLPVQDGPSLFARASAQVQHAVLGRGKLAAYRAGDLDLTDLVGFHDDPVWGPVRWERSMLDVRTNGRTGGSWDPTSIVRTLDGTPTPVPRGTSEAGWLGKVADAKARLPQDPQGWADLRADTITGGNTPLVDASRVVREAGQAVDDEIGRRVADRVAVDPLPDVGALERAEAAALQEASQSSARYQGEYGRGVDRISRIDPAAWDDMELVDRKRLVYADPQVTAAREAMESTNDAYLAAREAVSAARYAEADLWRETTLEVLGEVRPLGRGGMTRAPRTGATHTWGKGTVRAARESIESALDVYPTEWVQASADWGPLHGTTVQRGYYQSAGQGRTTQIRTSPVYTPNTSAVAADRLYETSVHELGHRMENVVDGIRLLERGWYVDRTWVGGVDPGTAQLRRIYPRSTFGADEKARPDQFINAYIGKDYGPHGSGSYEILSMGAEAVFTGSEGGLRGLGEWQPRVTSFYSPPTADDDMRRFILGLLAAV